MSNVIEQIEQQIAKLSTQAVRKNTGVIRTIADGVAKIEGLTDVMYNEMVQFPGGVIGIALNFIGIDPIKALIYSAVANGIIAPVILVFIVRIASSEKVMGEHRTARVGRVAGWLTVGLMAAAGAAVEQQAAGV